MALIGGQAQAGTTGSKGDDPHSDPPAFVDPVSHQVLPGDTDPHSNDGCDTLDPVATQNGDAVSYKCIDSDPAATNSDHGIADVTAAAFETSGAVSGFGGWPAPPAGSKCSMLPGQDSTGGHCPTGPWQVTVNNANGTRGSTAVSSVHIQFKTRGRFPSPGTAQNPAEVALETGGATGFVFDTFFQDAKTQNARQTIGNTIDCTRYAHMGPYLTGNREMLNVYYEMNFDGTQWAEDVAFGHIDPVAANNWAFLERAPSQTVGDNGGVCTGSTPDPAVFGVGKPDPGTSRVIIHQPDNHTVDVYLGMSFHFYDNQDVPKTYTLMRPGDTVNAINFQMASNVNAATVPAIDGCTLGDPDPGRIDPGTWPAKNCTVRDTVNDNVPGGFPYQAQQGVSNTFLLDWLPASSFDLGQTSQNAAAAPGPSCPSFEAMEYQPGGGKNTTGGLYTPIPKGPGGEDRDTQLNPVFGLDHYDSSNASGTTNNDLTPVPQDHHGNTQCDINVTTAAWWTLTGYTVTA